MRHSASMCFNKQCESVAGRSATHRFICYWRVHHLTRILSSDVMKKFTPTIYSWIEIMAKLKYALMFISDCTVFLMLDRRWYGSPGVVELAYTHSMVFTLKPRQNGRYFFADHIISFISWKNTFVFCLKIHRKLDLMVAVNNKSSLFQIMARCRTVDKSFSETMKAWSTNWGWVTHICVSKKIQSWLQIMVCRLFGSKPLSEPMLPYCQLDSEECISVKSYFKFKVYVQEDSLENVVCEMVAILPQPQCVNSAWVSLCYVAVTVPHL